MQRILLFAFFSFLTTVAQAAVELTWHSYVHNPSGQVHFVLHQISYRRGLFFGSCGASTRSLQWEYSLELKGAGPDYGKNDIEVKDGNFQVVSVESGTMRIDRLRRRATIDLVVKDNSGRREFIGNGKFKLKAER